MPRLPLVAITALCAFPFAASATLPSFPSFSESDVPRDRAPKWLIDSYRVKEPFSHFRYCGGTFISSDVLLMSSDCPGVAALDAVDVPVPLPGGWANRSHPARALAETPRWNASGSPSPVTVIKLWDAAPSAEPARIASYRAAREWRKRGGILSLHRAARVTGDFYQRRTDGPVSVRGLSRAVATAPVADGDGTRSPSWRLWLGGGIFAEGRDDARMLTGILRNDGTAMPLDAVWPRVYRTLLDHGARDAAWRLARQVLDPYETDRYSARATGMSNRTRDPEPMTVTIAGRQPRLGSIHPFENPSTKAIEFFRLVRAPVDGQIPDIPLVNRDTADWEYLGRDLPSRQALFATFATWNDATRRGQTGDVYVYPNRHNGDVEYFRLTAVDGGGTEGTYGYFPTDKRNNQYWTYLGTDLLVEDTARR